MNIIKLLVIQKGSHPALRLKVSRRADNGDPGAYARGPTRAGTALSRSVMVVDRMLFSTVTD